MVNGLPRIAFLTKKNVAPGEELVWDYRAHQNFSPLWMREGGGRRPRDEEGDDKKKTSRPPPSIPPPVLGELTTTTSSAPSNSETGTQHCSCGSGKSMPTWKPRRVLQLNLTKLYSQKGHGRRVVRPQTNNRYKRYTVDAGC